MDKLFLPDRIKEDGSGGAIFCLFKLTDGSLFCVQSRFESGRGWSSHPVKIFLKGRMV